MIDTIDTMITTTRQIAGEENESLACIANGLLVCIAKERLDEITFAKMEEKLDLQKIYTWKQFKEELEKHANQLVCNNQSDTSKPAMAYKSMGAVTHGKPNPNSKNTTPNIKCAVCQKEGHRVWACTVFGPQDPKQRLEVAKQKGLCFNCLVPGHSTQACKSTRRCQACNAKHHTLLHRDEANKKTEQTHESSEDRDAAQASTSTSK